LNDRGKEEKMSKAGSKHGREEECIEDFGGKTRMKETIRKT
jgi:hypothetical protein